MAESESSPDDRLVEEAARWIVGLGADDADERVRCKAGFDAWKQADPRHAEAAARMESLVERMQRVRVQGVAGPATAALDAALAPRSRPSRIRRLSAAAAVLFALALPLGLALKAYPAGYLLADMRTQTGRWESHTLDDGTRIMLSGASAVNLRFDARQRVVELVRGDVLVDVAPDADRPFTVVTEHGRVRALGTRFVVATEAQASVLSMLESSVALYTRSADETPAAVLSAGQQVRFTAAGVDPVSRIDATGIEQAWHMRHLVVQAQPLPEVLEQLNRHRRGRIHFLRAELQQYKVSAVLPLDDPDRALDLLAESFPGLRVRTITPWLVLVGSAQAE